LILFLTFMNQPTRSTFLTNRWVQLSAGIIGMISVTNLQYSWTFFVPAIAEKHSWSTTEIQWAFTIFVLAETWLVPIEAYLADLLGARPLVFVGGILVASSWVINSAADSLGALYLGNGLGGAGAGIVYGITIGNALRWFPDRRGLAAGLTAAAFGAGSALTVAPIRFVIQEAGYQAAFFWFGLGQGAMVLAVALLMRVPHNVPSQRSSFEGKRDFTPLEMLATPLFWLLYAMMTLVTVGGLMAIAQLAPMAESSFGDVTFLVLGWSVTAVTLASYLERILSGLTRPFFGWVSDQIGRETTMFIAFLLEAGAILGLVSFSGEPALFVVFIGLTMFGWGEVYSLFPALCGDMFGRRFATTNYGLLYTAKGTASLLVPLGNYLFEVTRSWTPIFALAIGFDMLVAFLALFVLKPLRERFSSRG
jgi:OFA family oxalate/formate antiporter-like MFS transporter